jgi:hypothetical protein
MFDLPLVQENLRNFAISCVTVLKKKPHHREFQANSNSTNPLAKE